MLAAKMKDAQSIAWVADFFRHHCTEAQWTDEMLFAPGSKGISIVLHGCTKLQCNNQSVQGYFRYSPAPAPSRRSYVSSDLMLFALGCFRSENLNKI
jgi:hypothetical protein